MKITGFILLLAVICGLATGCQTAKQVSYLEMLTSTNATFVATSVSAYTGTEDRVYQFLNYNLQRTVSAYNINTNLDLFVLSVEDTQKLARVAESLARESEADADTAFAVQQLIS